MSNVWLVNANALTLLAVFYAVSFIDFGAIIANHNVRHCAEMDGGAVQLDLAYLGRIGPSALPALRWYLDHSAKVTSLRTDWAKSIAFHIENDLKERDGSWRAWTFREHRLLKSVEASQAPALSCSPRSATVLDQILGSHRTSSSVCYP